MRTEFREAIAHAGQMNDASSMVLAIKRAVANEIRAADPSVSVAFTDYFDNIFVPDLVLRWPAEKCERLVYVRANPSADWLLDGIEYVSAHKAMVFTLEDFGPAGKTEALNENRRKLASTALATDTWVTDPSGVAAVSAVRGEQPYLGLLGQALLRGGRGVYGGSEVAELASKTAAGFVASRQLSAPETRRAVQAIEDSLDGEQSARLTRLLWAMWEGHGGTAASFPRASSAGQLTDDDLSYLLSAVERGTADFWRRFGHTVTTAQLARVHTTDPSKNLQAFVKANLDGLQARGIRVVVEPFRLDESDEIPRWLTAKGCLALRGLNWTAYVAARRTEELPPADEVQVPDLATLRRRAGEERAPVMQVQLGRGGRAVTYESKDGTDILDDPGLQQAAASLGVVDVERAVTAIDGDHSLGVDFAQRTAVGPTNAVFPLGALLRAVLPLISDLDDKERAALRATLESRSFAADQP